MPDISLAIIPMPAERTRTVLRPSAQAPAPLAIGEGDVNLLCGACSFVLAENLGVASQLQNFVLICPSCSAPNDTRS